MPSKPAHADRKRRKPVRADGPAIIPDPFAASAIIHGERVFVAEDMRHDEARDYAQKLGAHAVEGVWISAQYITQAKTDADRDGANYQLQLYRLLADLDKALTKLEPGDSE